MKNRFLIIALLFSMLCVAQEEDSWQVTHNKTVLLKASTESEAKNTITIKRSDLQKTGFLTLNYSDKTAQRGWERSIILYSKTDLALNTQKGATWKISNAILRLLSKNRNKLLLYTIALPTDPAIRARVRVRRVHLCTIEIRG
ncbi:MAG: hypothetical protein JWP69_530 [Flaviaesturariibacter sp.]|nr:hypothetical protein [Flaviaesturariibacter sp.]